MVPRADIVAVQHDITIGALIRIFESAAHSRLVVYNDTLDDPLGMIHIRDLIAFLTARATASAKRKRSPAGLDLKAVDLSMPLSETKIVRAASVRSAFDAGHRPPGQDAGDPHSSRAGHR